MTAPDSTAPRLTRELALELFSYDQGTGVFRWAVKRGRTIKIGDVAGHMDRKGYIRIGLNKQNYSAHRLAWLIVHGNPLPEFLDHIDRNRSNNAIGNLRAATAAENRRNTPSRGYHHHSHDQRFRAVIKINGRQTHIGSFDTAEEARAAYIKAHIEFAGEFSPYLRAERP